MLSLDSMKTDEILKCLNVSEQFLIISVTDLKGVILDVSDAFCTISGYTREELIGKPHNVVRHPDSSSAVFKEMWETIKSGKQWQGELKNLKKDGGYYWVITTVFPRFDNDNNIIGFFSIRQDITAMKDAVEKEELIKSQAKCASMGEMVGVVAHQWMQPIGTIASANARLQLKSELGTIENEDIAKTTDSIEKSLKFITDTINNFRNFFKESAQYIDISILDLIEYSLSIVRPLVEEKHVRVHLNYDRNKEAKEWIIQSVSKNDFSHIMLNLIKNSVDAFEGNPVSNPLIEINLGFEGDNITLELSDNAGGIPEDKITEVFEKKYSTKGEQGTGLGLYMVRMIIERHFGGKITARNKENGASFLITIPKRKNES